MAVQADGGRRSSLNKWYNAGPCISAGDLFSSACCTICRLLVPGCPPQVICCGLTEQVSCCHIWLLLAADSYWTQLPFSEEQKQQDMFLDQQQHPWTAPAK